VEENEDLELSIQSAAVHPEDDGTFRVLLQTSRGEIRAILHPSAGSPHAVLYVGGALGGFEGPAHDIYGRLARRLQPQVAGLRLHYREPGEFFECVVDVMAGCSFLRGIGAANIALVGHSLGGAVVIKAGELTPSVTGVAALSSQLYGTRSVEALGKRLLLVHGKQDGILDYAASVDIHERALEPKQLVLYDDADHSLAQAAGELEELLAVWLVDAVAGPPASRN
jgi:esterase/lipase